MDDNITLRTQEQSPLVPEMTIADSVKLPTRKVDSEDEQKHEDYGCWVYRPRCLQCMNNIRCHVIWQCVFNFFEGFIVNGVINVVLVALEKRYLLKSSKSGLIDNQLNDSQNMCFLGKNASDTCGATETEDVGQSTTIYYALLMVGNILLGIGASPMFTIGLSYIDENCKPNNTAFYISWTFCAAAVGVAVGYVVGGQTLSLFVDINTVDSASVSLTPADPQWVGAWWIAPLIAMAGFLLVTIPIFGYPRRLPNYVEVQEQRAVEAHGGGYEVTAHANFGKSWKDFPKSVWLLITNPTYVFICCGAAVEALIIGGMATFGSKIIQEKFNVDIIWAGTVMGIITIPGSGGGMLLGGYLVKRFSLKCRGIIRMCAGFMLASVCFGPFMLAHCPSDPVVGIDRPYMAEGSAYGLRAECNMDCGCSTQGFEPLCVGDSIYFSPCHAGCIASDTTGQAKVYSNCSCISTFAEIGIGTTNTSGYSINHGICSGKCPWVWVFCACFLVVMILTFATMSPGVTALFRCVPDKQRSVGIGVNLLFVRLVGTTPGPILLGAIIDSTCTVWQDTCGKQGSCWVYDKSQMGLRIMLWFMVLKILGILLFLIASIVYKPPTENIITEKIVHDFKKDESSITKL